MLLTEEPIAPRHSEESCCFSIVVPFAPRRSLVEWLLRRGRRDLQTASVRFQKLDDAVNRIEREHPLRAHVFRRRMIEGMPQASVAAECGLTEDHVQIACDRARAAIETELNRNV
jgi:hypothetical protein